MDGAASGSPVAVSGGQATSAPVSGLAAGGHAVSASYSGDTSLLASTATLTQVVNYVVTVTSPAAGASVNAGSTVNIRFVLTDAAGQPIPTAKLRLSSPRAPAG